MEDAAAVRELVGVLGDYAPSIPEEVVEFYLQQVGFVSADARVTRMVALAAHKLLEDVMHDAMQFQRIRQHAQPSGTAEQRAVLSMEDLAASLKEYGVNLCKPEYVSDSAQ